MIVRLFFNGQEIASLGYDLHWSVYPTNDFLTREIQKQFDEVVQGSTELDGAAVEVGIEAIAKFVNASRIERWPASG